MQRIEKKTHDGNKYNKKKVNYFLKKRILFIIFFRKKVELCRNRL